MLFKGGVGGKLQENPPHKLDLHLGSPDESPDVGHVTGVTSVMILGQR